MLRDEFYACAGFPAENLMKGGLDISSEGLLICERIQEIMTMCAREDPMYENISSFSIALYTLGYSDCPDLMSFEDVDEREAAEILKEEFYPVHFEDVPVDYNIAEFGGRYLLVVGDPLFPLHFAVLTDTRSDRPFFSKLPFFGSGFDSLSELMDEFAGYDGIRHHEIRYFKQKPQRETASSIEKREIYIVKE